MSERTPCNVHASTLMQALAIFFFSSRRRHTRSDRDWSSDVCSSDLRHVEAAEEPALDHQCLTRLEAGERLEGGLETEQLIRAAGRLRDGVVEGGDGQSTATVLRDRKSTRLNSSHDQISYAVFFFKKKKQAYILGDYDAPLMEFVLDSFQVIQILGLLGVQEDQAIRSRNFRQDLRRVYLDDLDLGF